MLVDQFQDKPFVYVLLTHKKEHKMKSRKIVLCDLDGTLIDKQYALTAPIDDVVKTIRKIKQEGWLVGMNSDTPFEPLRFWAKYLEMNGPVICEKGQVLAISPEDRPQIYGTMTDFFQRLRQEVALQVQEKIEQAFVGIGDVTEFIARRGRIFGRDKYAVLINGYRKCSFSGYAMACCNGDLVRDHEIFERFNEIVISTIGADIKKLEADKNIDYGILILHEYGVLKSQAIKRLIDRLGDEFEYVMIGDGESDVFSESGYSVRVCAVGNAQPLLKENAKQSGGIIAEESYTKGVLEILNNL
jgi:hydroxymethylpyrimidine pyrophosphatase-like HAD family hydrolase